ncbi:unnamed protein product [Rotaria socialis]|uniref:Uncharacterized protein n=1 Tax=Rotaria socialis TaxID=392032 RepID=A0A821F157_9BILA|nr:unnamed protein product [Rotaria socialis]CAF3335636.1 unnamed protein product [Rotaria socialis]CAF3457768.1 unnamed protein product [Rotaria socialis]CAF3548939.1 unnamed protein product [Rotaria socialis]CAF4186332.1 unnamed protein product [Rotaria socialis]
MEKLRLNPILVSFIFLFFCLTTIDSYPCPSECICQPTDMTDDDFTRMSYNIDCTNVTFKGNQVIYNALSWSIIEDKTTDDDDDDDGINNDYAISIDLSDSSLLKQFNNQAIQLTGFSFSLKSLSLTSQSKNLKIESNAFNSSLYQDLKILNLSSCCQQLPFECPQLFRPLNKLQVLDLSGSDMYKSCLNTPDTISSKLSDLILRNNLYDTNTFSHSSRLFDGVHTITGKLDLQYSRFNMSRLLEGNCLFDIFNSITTLDLSFLQFNSLSTKTEDYLVHLLKCKSQPKNIRHGEQLINLYLRQINLEYLPEWFTNDRFPLLNQLDLSYNNIYTVDFRNFKVLKSVSLANNPIEIEKILFRSNYIYESINLRSTIQNRTYDLQARLEYLFKLTTDVDFSENYGVIPSNITKFPIDIDFSKELSLNISQTNIYSFNIQDISKFDDLNRLNISLNNLTELNLEKQSKLSYLDCSNQYLKTLILNKDYSNLIDLKCSNNSLKAIENFSFLNHKKLKSIDLSFNLIESLENLLSNLNSQYLHTINLKSNSIKQISSNIFHSKLVSLSMLDLSSNKINIIKKYSFQSPNLQILDLSNNPLKFVDSKFLVTPSLHLFYIINNAQQLIDRCAQSSPNDNLLLTYITWFEQNGTYMKNTQPERSKQIQLDKCLRRYTSRSKVKWVKVNENYDLKHLSLYITMAAITIGIMLGIIYLYKNTKINVLTNFQRYRPLDGHSLVENTDDISHHEHEDDEIIMNLTEVPFNINNRC